MICIICLGCADTKGPTTQPMTANDRQNEALRDPFGYGPRNNQVGQDMPSVSGGGLRDFDRKGFDRDVDRVLNP
ncbi:MAG TPA: hypothetical protein VH518_17015 [Tepidisphaeraceae bacterium]